GVQPAGRARPATVRCGRWRGVACVAIPASHRSRGWAWERGFRTRRAQLAHAQSPPTLVTRSSRGWSAVVPLDVPARGAWNAEAAAVPWDGARGRGGGVGQAVAGFDRGGDGRDGDATAGAVLGQRAGAVPHRAVGAVAGGAGAAGLGHVRGGGGVVAGGRAGGRCRRGAARAAGPSHGDGGGDVGGLIRPVVPLVGGGGRLGGGRAGAGEPGDQPAGRRGRAGGAPRYGGGDQTVRSAVRRVG